MLSSHSLATTTPSTDSGNAVVQAIPPGRSAGRAATSTPSRSSPGSSACIAVSSSPRPAPMSTTVSSPASRVIRTSARANSGDAWTDVRKCAAGASCRKKPSAPYKAASHACFHVGCGVGGGTAGIPNDVIAQG